MGSKVLQRQLELLRLAVEHDLDDDGRVERDGGGGGGRHDGRTRLGGRSNAPRDGQSDRDVLATAASERRGCSTWVVRWW